MGFGGYTVPWIFKRLVKGDAACVYYWGGWCIFQDCLFCVYVGLRNGQIFG